MKRGKYIYLPVMLFSIIIIAGCGNPVYVEKDDSANLSGYKTYMWVDTRTGENDKKQKASPYAEITIHNAVNAELGKKGWREVQSNPDVLLMYDVLVERTTVQQSDPVYTQPFARYFYNPYRGRWSTFYYPSRFAGYQVYEVPVKEGTLTITMADARTDKTIWQGWTTETLSESRLTPEEINRTAKRIFRKFQAT